ncbi:MAG: putative photosynthetic complex assembly protein PuhE [Beijerinckiaceae bacterium]|jgi:putative photosynthetic complex assembly protein 2|nr:putative photosynthetic complex assembly protein PuhE [Beijerinckiaceae bacterium]
MDALALPIVMTLFVWWFATGAVLFLTGLPRATHGWSMAIATLVGLGGLAALFASARMATPTGAYIAFFGAMAVWAWNEVGFLLGHVTGSRRTPSPPGIRGWSRFVAATQTLIHHELLILASALAILAITWDEPNQVGIRLFLVLWLMRLSTKFNIFLGVPNVTVEFLPAHLAYLATYFRNRPMNGLFPFSVTASTLVTAWLCHSMLTAPAGSFEATGHALIAALMALAVLEHWFLVIPLPFGELWSWGLASRPPVPEAPKPTEAAERVATCPVLLPISQPGTAPAVAPETWPKSLVCGGTSR